MRRIKFKIKSETIFKTLREIERFLREEFLIQIGILIVTLGIFYYLVGNGYRDGSLNNTDKTVNIEDMSMIDLAKKAVYMHITHVYGIKNCYFVNSRNTYELCKCYGNTHPRYGTPVYEIDEEIAYSIAMTNTERGFLPGEEYSLWTIDGYPLVFYYYLDGRYECFNMPGIHPDYGEMLIPVTTEVAIEWKNLIQDGQYHRFILNEDLYRDPLSEDYLVSLLDRH